MDICYRQIFNSDFNEIKKCAEDRGNAVLNNMYLENHKLDPYLIGVPWITFNDVRNAQASSNFLDAVCSQTSCTGRSSAISSCTFKVNGVLLLLIVIISIKFCHI